MTLGQKLAVVLVAFVTILAIVIPAMPGYRTRLTGCLRSVEL